MLRACPYCQSEFSTDPDRPSFRRAGRFYRKSDGQWVQRFRCGLCGKRFSNATSHPCFAQNKRHLNYQILKLLTSGNTQRGIAQFFKISRKTVSRKLKFLASQAQVKFEELNRHYTKATTIEFDDMETFEHTKLKPLSITVAVEFKTRRILGFQVSPMPAKGKLAQMSREKYGPREDKRPQARDLLFNSLKPLVVDGVLLKSDKNPHYTKDVKRHFPNSNHQVTKGRRGCVTGQGELKRGGFDPLFSLNHTCAMTRARISRLFRRTWNTTKKAECLVQHLQLYAYFHNSHLI